MIIRVLALIFLVAAALSFAGCPQSSQQRDAGTAMGGNRLIPFDETKIPNKVELFEADEHYSKAVELKKEADLKKDIALKEAAQKELVEAIKINPKNPDYFRLLFNITMDLQKYELSLEAIQEVAKLAPNSVSDRLNLAWNYAIMNRFDSAISTYKEALLITDQGQFRMAKDNVYMNLAWTYVRKAQMEQSSDYSDAEDMFKEGMAKFPESVLLIGHYGRFLTEVKRDYKKAIVVLNGGLARKGLNWADEYQLLIQKGDTYMAQQDYKNAYLAFEKAMKISKTPAHRETADEKFRNAKANYEYLLKQKG